MAIRYLIACSVLLILQFFNLVQGNVGIDVSESVSSSSFQCLKTRGYDFVVVRAFRSNGVPDSNAPPTIRNARTAGFQMVDAYMFPCPKCGNPLKQVQDMVGLNLDVKMIWLDIEIFNWFDDKNRNRRFFEDLLSALEHYLPIGVYTNQNNWSVIMGSDYNGGSSFPLWYAHYDGQPSFADFKPFGGWHNPTIKQFAGDENICESSIDVNWKP